MYRIMVSSLADSMLDKFQVLSSPGESKQFMSYYSGIFVGFSHYYSSSLLYLDSTVDCWMSRKLKATFLSALMSKSLQAACKFSHRL